MHGQFVWYELTTPDVDASRAFYPHFTNWETQRFDNDYVLWTSDGAPIAGIFPLSDEMKRHGVPPNWLAYVEVNDVDATVNQAKVLGATVLAGPGDVPNPGRFAVLVDPQGAAFGVYKPAGPSTAWNGTPRLNRFSWHELMSTDFRAAFEFYHALFGWVVMDEMDMGGGNAYRLFGNGDKMFGGMFNRMPDMASMPPFWLYYIMVADINTAVAAATKAGARLHRGPMDIPGGQIAILGDPQGAGFALHAMTAGGPEQSTAKSAAAPAKRRQATTAKKVAAKKPPKKRTVATSKGSKRVSPKAVVKRAAKRPTKGSAKNASRGQPRKRAAKRGGKKRRR